MVLDEMLFGFESEIVVYTNRFESPEKCKDRFLVDLEKHVGIEFSRSLFGKFSDFTMNKTAKNFKTGLWFADHDASIMADNPKKSVFGNLNWAAIEIVSPPMKYNTFIQTVERLFQFYEKHNVETNGSTGFHVNISIPGEIDKLKLLVFLDEDNIKIDYPRSERVDRLNMASRKNAVVQEIKSFGDYDLTNIISFANNIIFGQININGDITFKHKTNDSGSEKGFTVSFSRLPSRGYIEFRMIGGENYHKKLNKIVHTIDRYIEVMNISSNCNKYKKQYNKKIKLLLTT